ncbi:hypothetical protein PEBR_41253 [Penicillium brasilianum]|uniref:DUF7732 domain-containing protein n=1 Tax=Penicillium brasilianum TaxID=104259 RepID=A0A1S9R8R7_PENBI|nr:hypothetical protein PEBR_41253 [Penicillium brasilianum]
MKLAWASTVLLLGSQGVTSLSIPFTSQSDLIERSSDTDLTTLDAQFVDLEKRRGGGGGGGRSGGGSSSSSSGSSSSSSSSGSSSGGSSGGRSGSSSSSSGSTSSSSNRGGSSSGGSGVTPSYGGGRYDSSNPSHGTTFGSSRSGSSGGSSWPWMWETGSSSGGAKTPKTKNQKPLNTITEAKTFGHNRYYAGGARSPYTAGARSTSGITPFLLPAAALAFFPGIWLAGAYAYNYPHGYNYHNNTNNKNESLPVVCLCEEYQECGCDDNNNSTYYESLFNGTQPRNTSMVRVANVNGTEKIVINGTLANGTTTDDGSSSSTSSTSTSGAAQGPLVTLINASGYWVMVAVVIATVWSF